MAKHKKVKFSADEMAHEPPVELDFSKLREIPGGLSGLVRHVAATRVKRTIELAPDVYKAFPNAKAVNTALRLLIQLKGGLKAKRKKTPDPQG